MTKKIITLLLLLIFASEAVAFHKPKFKPFKIGNLEPTPAFWQVKPSDVIRICKEVQNARTEIIARTPLGYPIYAVFFGDFSEAAPKTNWAAGASSTGKEAYLGDSPRNKQTLLFVAGVHGSEPENVAAAVNMIKLLDSGKDLRGKEDPEFLKLATSYRIIIVPCVNMDGRLISPDHFRGQPYEVFRAASQGTWKDGSPIEWKGSKEWFPLPLDKVSYPGGYPNSRGYNIQHDVSPGNMQTAEARAVCRLMARWRVDFFLNGHSCEWEPHIIRPSDVDSPANIMLGRALTKKVNHAFTEAGLRRKDRHEDSAHNTINLTNTAYWNSGALGLTLESYHGCANINGEIVDYSFEQLMEPAFIAMKVIMKEGLTCPLSSR